MTTWNSEDRAFLAEAVSFFESDSFLKRLTEKMSQPADALMSALPEKLSHKIDIGSQVALRKALGMAIGTLSSGSGDGYGDNKKLKSSFLIHTALAGASGAVAGTFGLASLLWELPLSTGIILRSIASIASEWGEDLSDPETIIECLTVFGLTPSGDKGDLGALHYYIERVALGKSAQQAKIYMGQYGAKEILRSLENGSSPALVNFLAAIASRFKINASYKGLSKSVPIVGAVSGAGINVMFSKYYADAANYHFGLRALGRLYGEESLRKAYEALAKGQAG